MKPSQNCINLIKNDESFSAIPYLDRKSKGIWTIGYGTTYLPNGSKVTQDTPMVTEFQASLYLLTALNKVAEQINQLIKPEIILTQNQFDALCSFVYNVGVGNFKDSTLLKRININPNDPDIEIQFNRWIYDDGIVLNGLKKRRLAEANLYFKA